MKSHSQAGTVVLERVESRALKGNALGDPHVRTVPVYLPPGYEKGTRRYPVIYVLAGFTAGGKMLLNTSAFGEAMDQRLDRLMGTGAMKPCVVVMPDCLTSLGGSQYLNSRGTGRYEDHLSRELVRFVDARYRTLPEARHRGVVGKSSGGFGALVHGMWHPDIFGAIGSHSGDMAFEYCYQQDFARVVTDFGLAGGPEGWMRKFRAARKKSHAQMTVINIVAMAAAYTPNPRLPIGAAFPFDLETGEIDEPVWKRWLALDPLNMMRDYARALKGMRLVFLDAGTRDEWSLHLGARRFAKKARALGIKVVHEEFDDGHMDVGYRYDVSLPLIARAIS